MFIINNILKLYGSYKKTSFHRPKMPYFDHETRQFNHTHQQNSAVIPPKHGGHMPKYLSFALTTLLSVNAFAQTEWQNAEFEPETLFPS